jgi:hypothetical protein
MKDGEKIGKIFLKNIIINNNQVIRKIVISDERDGTFAVGDVDILLRNRKNEKTFWYDRVQNIHKIK